MSRWCCVTPQRQRRVQSAPGTKASRAVQEHLDRLHVPGEVAAGSPPGIRQIRYTVGRPVVSIIIPSKDQPRLLERCVESLLAGEYPSQEIVLVDTGSVTPEARAVNARSGCRVPASGCCIGTSRSTTPPSTTSPSARRAEKSWRFSTTTRKSSPPIGWTGCWNTPCGPNVGAVGAKLLYSNGTLQHAGIVLGLKNKHLRTSFATRTRRRL